MVLLECKTNKLNSQLEHRQPMEQTRGLFCMCDLGVAWYNHHISVTSGEWVRSLKPIAWASEHGSCQSNSCNSWGYEQLQKSKDSLKDCFENVNIDNEYSYYNICTGLLWHNGLWFPWQKRLCCRDV